MTSILMVFILCWMITGCSDNIPDHSVINDFETDSDLDRLTWKCHTLLSLSYEHATHGQACLLMGLYPPSAYPGVSFKGYMRDWRPYKRLAMEIFNPEDQGELFMVIRIDDKEDDPEYEDRVNRRIVLKPGMNHVTLSMDSLITPSGRHLELRHIHALMMFMVDPTHKTRLFVDHVRLEKHATR